LALDRDVTGGSVVPGSLRGQNDLFVLFIDDMFLPAEPTLLAYIVVGLVALSQLPRFGRAVLAFLRDYNEYREGR